MPEGSLVLIGGTIYPSPEDHPIADGVVVVRDGRIAEVGVREDVAIPGGARVIDCSGLVVAAGFWNCHVHFLQRKWGGAEGIPAGELEREIEGMLTGYGFTSVFDLGSPLENTLAIRARVESGEVAGPRIRTTGPALLGEGWLPSAEVLGALGFLLFPMPEVSDVEGAAAAASGMLERGADGVKVFAAEPRPPFSRLPDEVMRAAVGEAHRRGKPVFAHPTNPDGLLAAVRAGVDVVAHTTPHSGPWDKGVLEAMHAAEVALVPTLKIWKHQLRHERASVGETAAREGAGQLAAWVAGGGVVLFGTDVGGMDDYDPAGEYALMAGAGMSFRQILAALTTAPAKAFGESHRLGRIAPGLLADLVVLEGDPARDVSAFARVVCTLRDGRVIFEAPR